MPAFLKRLLRRGRPRTSRGLDDVIPAEITGDAFYRAIVRYASSPRVRNILEIGSSAGEGSTRAFVEGILANPTRPRLHCMEVSQVRFDALRRAYAAHDFVRPFHLSSVPPAAFPTPEEVERFYTTHSTSLNRYPLETVLGWLQADLAYVASHGLDQHGIRLVKEAAGVDVFDLVLIDGSEFTGRAELAEVMGADVVMLDDVNAFKNHESYHLLAAHPDYRLEEEDWSLRNGYAVFTRRR